MICLVSRDMSFMLRFSAVCRFCVLLASTSWLPWRWLDVLLHRGRNFYALFSTRSSALFVNCHSLLVPTQFYIQLVGTEGALTRLLVFFLHVLILFQHTQKEAAFWRQQNIRFSTIRGISALFCVLVWTTQPWLVIDGNLKLITSTFPRPIPFSLVISLECLHALLRWRFLCLVLWFSTGWRNRWTIIYFNLLG